MLDMNNLPKQKREGICKIIDLVLVVLLAVFFILSLCPYYSVSKGDVITVLGYGDTKADEDDSWSLDRKSTRLNSSHCVTSRMPSSA